MKVIDKIQALRRLSENPSATPAEAESAAARVMELMLKHKLSEADIPSAEQDEIRRQDEPLFRAKHYCKWRSQLGAGIANLHACRVIRTSSINGDSVLDIAGKSGDVEVVRHLFAYVSRECERHALRHLKLTALERVSARRRGLSFRIGFVYSILRRLEAQKETTKTEAAASGQSHGLMRLDQDETAIEAWLASQKSLITKQPRNIGVDAASYRAGEQAGNALAIQKAIA